MRERFKIRDHVRLEEIETLPYMVQLGPMVRQKDPIGA